jgi:hypothetical protein
MEIGWKWQNWGCQGTTHQLQQTHHLWNSSKLWLSGTQGKRFVKSQPYKEIPRWFVRTTLNLVVKQFWGTRIMIIN